MNLKKTDLEHYGRSRHIIWYKIKMIDRQLKELILEREQLEEDLDLLDTLFMYHSNMRDRRDAKKSNSSVNNNSLNNSNFR